MPTSRQLTSRIGDADNGSTSSEADISRISRSRAGSSSSRGEEGKCGAYTIRSPPTATPIAAPSRQTGPTATPTSPKSALRVSLGSRAREISLGEMTLTRIPAPHSWRERSQPATKPSNARVEEKGARPFGPVSTAVTEGWRTRPWPFTPRTELQPATKPAKARVEEEKGARPFGPVSITATEGWRTRPSPFTLRAEQVISFGGLVAKETFGMTNDEESVEKALMASSLVGVTSEDSANSNLATLMPPAESLPGEVREPLSGEHQRLCQGEHQRLCEGEHQCLCQGEHQRLCQGEH